MAHLISSSENIKQCRPRKTKIRVRNPVPSQNIHIHNTQQPCTGNCRQATIPFKLPPLQRRAKVKHLLISFLFQRTEVNGKQPSPKKLNKRLSTRQFELSYRDRCLLIKHKTKVRLCAFCLFGGGWEGCWGSNSTPYI